MRSPEEIKEAIDSYSGSEHPVDYYYKPFMLEIMCNIAITLDKIAKQGEPEIRIKEINDE